MRFSKGIRVLLLGPLPPAKPSRSNPVGGAAVNFAEMVRSLRDRDFEVSVVDTSRPRINLTPWIALRNNIITVFRVFRQTASQLNHAEVVLLNISAGATWTLGAFMWLLCALAGRPLALRIFGGDLALRYQRCRAILRWWADRTYMRSDVVYVQTRRQQRYFSARDNFRWHANTRDLPAAPSKPRTTLSRLLFMSQIRWEKGFRETLEACRELPRSWVLSIYGPVMPGVDLRVLEDHPIARYCGAVNPGDVPEIIRQHDLLLLPTYWESEGYPGIILEAMQCGRPVIATRWAGIPEVVEEEHSGLLVEPRSAASLRAAILRVMHNPELYKRLCEGARARGEFFRSRHWYDRMAVDLSSLAGE